MISPNFPLHHLSPLFYFPSPHFSLLTLLYLPLFLLLPSLIFLHYSYFPSRNFPYFPCSFFPHFPLLFVSSPTFPPLIFSYFSYSPSLISPLITSPSSSPLISPPVIFLTDSSTNLSIHWIDEAPEIIINYYITDT